MPTALGGAFLLLSPPSSEPELRRTGYADGQNQECPGQGRSKQRDRHGHLSVRTEEFDPHRSRVLHDEVDQGNAEDSGNGHRHPYPANAGVANAVSIGVSSRGPVVPLSPGMLFFHLVFGTWLDFGCGHILLIPNGTSVVTRGRSTGVTGV